VRQEIELVRELINIVEENKLAELNIDFKGFKVEIKKELPQQQIQVMPQITPQFSRHETVESAGPGGEGKTQTEETREVQVPGVPIISPLGGVFYRASKPGAPPFVNQGDTITPGQTLCIVEAMKLMNEITAEQGGRIVKVMKENAQEVAEGEILFYMEPEE
jgi:acetyl-CoA carboxylase biotin carboxyl carrier protein